MIEEFGIFEGNIFDGEEALKVDVVISQESATRLGAALAVGIGIPLILFLVVKKLI